MWRFALALAYVSSTALISPCLSAAASTPKRKKGPREITLAQFVQKLHGEGEATQFTSVLVKLTGFPPDSTKKGFDSPKSEAEDGASRIADLVFSKSATDEPAPVGLYWTTRREADRRSEMYYYRTALDGGLERAIRVDGQLDENGNAIRGAGKATALDVHSDEVRERFQRKVLDFWLKGKGRRKPGSKSAAKQPAQP